MASLFQLVVMSIMAWIAVSAQTLSRLLLGPTLPSWTWRTEWAVAGARQMIAVAARHPDNWLMNAFGRRVAAPLPPSLYGSIHVSRIRLGGVQSDRYFRLDRSPDVATLLYFHGGGYIFGNPGTHREFIARLVNATDTVAYAPRYRLAPEHKFPAAVDDGLDAYKALIDRGINPSTIIVCGDSAGGGLAMATVHRARRSGIPLPGGIILFSPYLDLRHTAYTIPLNANTDYLPLKELETPNGWYVTADQLDDPEASPLRADLHGFPRLLVFAGGAEMILDDSVRLKDHADAAGVDATLVIEPEMMHVWPALVPWQPASKRT
ncbi:MAG: alpha/beta hydrolase, partial [Acidimicrobiia bacterium]